MCKIYTFWAPHPHPFNDEGEIWCATVDQSIVTPLQCKTKKQKSDPSKLRIQAAALRAILPLNSLCVFMALTEPSLFCQMSTVVKHNKHTIQTSRAFYCLIC